MRWEGLRLFNTDQLWHTDAEVVGEVWPSALLPGQWAWYASWGQDDGGVEPTMSEARAACEAALGGMQGDAARAGRALVGRGWAS